MNNRIRTQKKVYTPTTSASEPECYLCQVVETGECMIVHRSNVDEANDSEDEKDANDDEQIVHLKSLSTLQSATKKTIDNLQTHIQGTLSPMNYPLDLNNFNLINLSSFRESGQDQKLDDVIYKGISLTRIRRKNIDDYGRQVLCEIFSHEELISSILLPDAMRSQYRIAADRYNKFYNRLVKLKSADFLADERKHDRKST
ncbi:unnamed protein product [Rotaria sordida]|uniref:Uncharacterized protein n=1 Tax=Rotaria sordida TaxID=392033 RepID=A0A819ZI51_9BILA|nr:unnamed protein product [Rotaria sordida]